MSPSCLVGCLACSKCSINISYEVRSRKHACFEQLLYPRECPVQVVYPILFIPHNKFEWLILSLVHTYGNRCGGLRGFPAVCLTPEPQAVLSIPPLPHMPDTFCPQGVPKTRFPKRLSQTWAWRSLWISVLSDLVGFPLVCTGMARAECPCIYLSLELSEKASTTLHPFSYPFSYASVCQTWKP